MGGLLHLAQQGRERVGVQPAQSPPHCTKCDSPPINGQCTNHCICCVMVMRCGFNVLTKELKCT